MGVYDQSARYTAKLDPAGFLCWLVPGVVRVWAYRDWLDTRTLPFPGEPDRTCDTVAGFVTLNGEGPPAAPDLRVRAVYGGLALIFAELAGRTEAWGKALEGWNVRESQIVLEWQAEAQRADLLRVLQCRFGLALPTDLAARTNAETDFDRL